MSTSSQQAQSPPEEDESRNFTASSNFRPQVVRATIPVSVDSAAREYFCSQNKATKPNLKLKLESLIFTLANMCLTSSINDNMRKDVFRPEICRAITRNATKRNETLDAKLLTDIQLKAMHNQDGSARASNIDLHFNTTNNSIIRTKLKTLSAEKPHYARHGCGKDNTVSLATQSRYSLLSIATVLASKMYSTDDRRDDNLSRSAVSSIFPTKDGSNELTLRLSVLDILQEALDTNELSTKDEEITSLIALIENMRETLVEYHHKFFYAESDETDASIETIEEENEYEEDDDSEKKPKVVISYDKFTEKLLIVRVCSNTISVFTWPCSDSTLFRNRIHLSSPKRTLTCFTN